MEDKMYKTGWGCQHVSIIEGKARFIPLRMQMRCEFDVNLTSQFCFCCDIFKGVEHNWTLANDGLWICDVSIRSAIAFAGSTCMNLALLQFGCGITDIVLYYTCITRRQRWNTAMNFETLNMLMFTVFHRRVMVKTSLGIFLWELSLIVFWKIGKTMLV